MDSVTAAICRSHQTLQKPVQRPRMGKVCFRMPRNRFLRHGWVDSQIIGHLKWLQVGRLLLRMLLKSMSWVRKQKWKRPRVHHVFNIQTSRGTISTSREAEQRLFWLGHPAPQLTVPSSFAQQTVEKVSQRGLIKLLQIKYQEGISNKLYVN